MTLRSVAAEQIRRIAQFIDEDYKVPQSISRGKPTKNKRIGSTFFPIFFKRLLIWLVALVIAFMMPLLSYGIPFPLGEWETKVIADHKFSDVFVATVSMVVLSSSNLTDAIITSKRVVNKTWTKGITWVLIVMYFIFIAFGLALYGQDKVGPASPPWVLLISMLVAGLLGEIIIAQARS